MLQISVNGQGEITPFYFQKCWPMQRITWFSYAIRARPLNIKGYFGIIIIPLLHRTGGILFCLCPSLRLSKDIFRHIFLSNYWWQKSDIWSQALYRYTILWEAFLDISDSCFLFADLVGFYTHWTYMLGYHKWALSHSSSCLSYNHQKAQHPSFINDYDIILINLLATISLKVVNVDLSVLLRVTTVSLIVRIYD